jgi:hypothetical protein
MLCHSNPAETCHVPCPTNSNGKPKKISQACSQSSEQRLLGPPCMPRPSAGNNSADTGRIFMKFDVGVFFENLSKDIKLY